MNLRDLNEMLESKRQEITAWMRTKRSEVAIPIYGSVDVRDACLLYTSPSPRDSV